MSPKTPNSPTDKLTPPPGFRFRPDILEDYDEQVRHAVADADYQAQPLPSFEDVSTLDIIPTFNPTDAPEDDIYARRQTTEHEEQIDNEKPVLMWRIVERGKVEDGTGLVSSRVLHHNTLGDTGSSSRISHLGSNDEGRMSRVDASTPFVSFSTDPEHLARDVILRHGFGVKGERDPVVICVQVDPGRVEGRTKPKNQEVLLIGGVAPEEYAGAYSVEDFINQLVPEGAEIKTIDGNRVQAGEALVYWSQQQ